MSRFVKKTFSSSFIFSNLLLCSTTAVLFIDINQNTSIYNKQKHNYNILNANKKYNKTDNSNTIQLLKEIKNPNKSNTYLTQIIFDANAANNNLSDQQLFEKIANLYTEPTDPTIPITYQKPTVDYRTNVLSINYSYGEDNKTNYIEIYGFKPISDGMYLKSYTDPSNAYDAPIYEPDFLKSIGLTTQNSSQEIEAALKSVSIYIYQVGNDLILYQLKPNEDPITINTIERLLSEPTIFDWVSPMAIIGGVIALLIIVFAIVAFFRRTHDKGY